MQECWYKDDYMVNLNFCLVLITFINAYQFLLFPLKVKNQVKNMNSLTMFSGIIVEIFDHFTDYKASFEYTHAFQLTAYLTPIGFCLPIALILVWMLYDFIHFDCIEV